MVTVSVVMPVLDGATYLPRVLAPLRQALDGGEAVEVIVVDDGSVDGSGDHCRRWGARVLASAGRAGPGACRNQGARAASGDVVLFVDADVVLHGDAFRKVRDTFDLHPDCVAVFGSYDDRPAAPGLVSQYRNLLHHYVHQNGEEDASTFWAGCGAVRRAAFLEAGGFDAARYPLPSIEDIELGHRLLRQGGRILLRKDLLGSHLKRWTLPGMIRNDVFRRAIPWARLSLRSEAASRALNLSTQERLRAFLAGLLLVSLLMTLLQPAIVWAALALLVLALLANFPFLLLVFRARGPLHALAAFALHQLFYLYSSLAYAWCLVERLFTRRPRVIPPRP